MQLKATFFLFFYYCFLEQIQIYFMLKNRTVKGREKITAGALKKMRGNKLLSFLTFGVKSVLYS